LTEDEQRAWRLWLEVVQRQTSAIEDDLQQHSGLSLSDYEILVTLSETPAREVRMSELAERAIISRSRLTYRVDRLVDKGHVVRNDADGDGRGVVAKLTPAGMQHLEQAAPHHVAKVRSLLFDHLDPVDLEGLNELLAKMIGPARGED
jgi:DNA-binding MarR family transcriptional regulator